MTVSVLWLFLTVPRVGLQCVIVVFSDYTDLLFHKIVEPDITDENCNISINVLVLHVTNIHGILSSPNWTCFRYNEIITIGTGMRL